MNCARNDSCGAQRAAILGGKRPKTLQSSHCDLFRRGQSRHNQLQLWKNRGCLPTSATQGKRDINRGGEASFRSTAYQTLGRSIQLKSFNNFRKLGGPKKISQFRGNVCAVSTRGNFPKGPQVLTAPPKKAREVIYGPTNRRGSMAVVVREWDGQGPRDGSVYRASMKVARMGRSSKCAAISAFHCSAAAKSGTDCRTMHSERRLRPRVSRPSLAHKRNGRQRSLAGPTVGLTSGPSSSRRAATTRDGCCSKVAFSDRRGDSA